MPALAPTSSPSTGAPFRLIPPRPGRWANPSPSTRATARLPPAPPPSPDLNASPGADFLPFNGGTVSFNTTTAWTMGKSIPVNSGNGTITASSSTITVTQDKPITWNSGNLTVNVVPLVRSEEHTSELQSL